MYIQVIYIDNHILDLMICIYTYICCIYIYEHMVVKVFIEFCCSSSAKSNLCCCALFLQQPEFVPAKLVVAPNRSVARSANRWNSEIFPQVKEVHFSAVQKILDCMIV